MSLAYKQPAPESQTQTTVAEPEWSLDYDLGAGQASALEAITGVGAGEDEAASLLDGLMAETNEQEPTEAPAPTGTATHKPSGTYGPVYAAHEKRAGSTALTLSASQKNELRVFQASWEKNHGRYEAVAAKTGVPAKLIAAIHYREASLRWDTYLHQGDPLGKPAVHHPSNIPVFYTWEDAAVHALNLKKGIRTSMGMDETSTDFAAMATYAEAYNGLGYYYKGKTSPYVYAGTNQYKGGRYVADGVYDPNSWDQRLGVIALMQGLDGVDTGKAPSPPMSEADAWGTVVAGRDVLRVGSMGPAVSALQKRLAAKGHDVTADGEFGPKTKAAVVAFQKANGLEGDGVVGAATAAKLDGAQAPTKPTTTPTNPEWARVLAGGLLIRRGDRGAHVELLQRLLTEKGFTTTVDGDFGPNTQAKVRAFQAANRLEVDGVVGRRTATALQG